jgi:hypothetical protein
MARSATPRRPADRRTGQPDRSPLRHLCIHEAMPSPSGGCSAGDGATVPTAPTASDQKTQALNPEDNPWAALPEADRQRLGRHFSRLLLLAVRSSARNPVQETLP